MTAVDPDLKSILACPKCRQPTLQWFEAKSEVHCPVCRLIYPIEDQIPVLLEELARPKSAEE